jgi:hypothetical protein
MIYSDKFDDLYGFFYDVKRAENGGNKVSLMLASNQWVHADDPIYEGDIIRFHHGAGDEIKTGIVECRPEHFCYWQVKVPGDRYGLAWATNCCTGMQVIGNRYTDREWLEDEGLGALLDEASREMNRIDRKFKAKMVDIEAGHRDRIEAIRETAEHKAALQNAVDQSLAMAADVKPIDPEKEKAARAAIEKFKIFSTEDWAREYSKIHFEPKPTPKPARIESDYRDDFGHKIKEGDILVFKLCGRRLTGEVKHIWSNDRYCWQVWTYESPEMKLSLRHMCEDIACSEVRVIGHISTVRRGGVAVQDIGSQL